MNPVSVTISTFGLWQMILGTKNHRVEAGGATLRDLIEALNEISNGKLKDEVLGAEGNLDPKFKIFVNGNASDNLNTQLSDGDDVVLFSVVDGG